MMAWIRLLSAAGLLGLAGCGGESPATVPPPKPPATVEEWHGVQEEEVKYDRRTLERLKIPAGGPAEGEDR